MQFIQLHGGWPNTRSRSRIYSCCTLVALAGSWGAWLVKARYAPARLVNISNKI